MTINKRIFDVWYDFLDQTYNENRFFVDHELLSHIEELVRNTEFVLGKDSELYRARIYKEEITYTEEFMKWINEYGESQKEAVEHEKSLTEEDTDKTSGANNDLVNNVSESAADRLYRALNESRRKQEEKDKREDLLNRFETEYWGYDADNSSAPKNNKMVKAGRANCERMIYLYLASDEMTAASEVRPIRNEKVSIATLISQRELRIADLSYTMFETIEEEHQTLAFLLTDAFSKPNNGDLIEYLPTQIISQYLKKLGYDGLKYNSSLYGKGRNYVIFKPDEFIPLSSNLYELSDICHEFKCIGPVGDIHGDKDLVHWKLETYHMKKIEDNRERFASIKSK